MDVESSCIFVLRRDEDKDIRDMKIRARANITVRPHEENEKVVDEHNFFLIDWKEEKKRKRF